MNGLTTRLGAPSRVRVRGLSPYVLPLILMMGMQPASAHIKWFAKVELQQAPRAPWTLWQGGFDFAWLAWAAMLVMLLVALIDVTVTRRLAGSDTRLNKAPENVLTSLRLGCALFFAANAASFHDVHVILTPELRTHSSWVPLMQWIIALTAVFGQGRLAALGVLALFGQGMAQYGLFHMLDYLLFIGLALCLWWSEARPKLREHALLILRWTLGLSLLWGATEKWLYPEWTYPLLCGDGRTLLMGQTPDFFMKGAGFIEFCTAFAIIYGAVASRVACLVLIALMCAAMPMFGFIDVVGHAPFILALATLAACPHNPMAQTPLPAKAWRYMLRWLALLIIAFLNMPFAYYLAHELLWDLRDLSFMPCSVALPLLLLILEAWRKRRQRTTLLVSVP